MRVGDFLVLIFLIGVLGWGAYVLWTYLPSEGIALRPLQQSQPVVVVQQNALQFYPNLRYPDREITYHIESACSSEKEESIIDAFLILERSTILLFRPVERNAQLIIVCSNIAPTAEQKNHFVAGEGGPTTVINSSQYYVILGGKVSLYRSDICDEPKVALHEILHALGFDHTNNPSSIMYPVTNCKQELDASIVETINELYQAPPAPDLTFLEVNATKAGRYLSFHVAVANYGLKDSEDVVLYVLHDETILKEFDLQEISIGTRKTLDVQNIRIPSSTTTISFLVSSRARTPELENTNNRVDLVVQE